MNRKVLALSLAAALAGCVAAAQTTTQESTPEQSRPGVAAQSQPGAPTPAGSPGNPDPTKPTTDSQQQQSHNVAVPQVTDAATLKAQLESAYASDPSISAARISVNVTDTTVELTGSVPNIKERTAARRIAQSYAMNRKVVDHLMINASGAPNPASVSNQSVGPTSSTPPNQPPVPKNPTPSEQGSNPKQPGSSSPIPQ